MLEQLLNHINRFALCKTTDKILLAVSGGVDSLVMLDLMSRGGFEIAIVHCNFQLRGDDSKLDEDHVRKLAATYKVPYFSKCFDTISHAKQNGISIQMAAREMRYAYFTEVLSANHFDYVATAHHLNDSIETTFLNLVRGTGIQGLGGIAGKQGVIIRPLLFATRDMIVDYAVEQGLRWREDSSNRSDDYQRNFFRHQVIPKFEEVNPNFHATFRDTHERLLASLHIYNAFIRNFRSSAVEEKGDRLSINITNIRESVAPATLLWELIKDRGFNYDQCRQILSDHQAGKVFYSAGSQLVVDRQCFLVTKKQTALLTPVSIHRAEKMVGNTVCRLTFTELSREEFQLKKDSALAQVDAGLVRYPLTWRSWQAGDYFVPLGMQHEKKLSDFLIDLKIPFNEKADVSVLESEGKIVWVVGYRISERFKITEATQHILVIEQGSAL